MVAVHPKAEEGEKVGWIGFWCIIIKHHSTTPNTYISGDSISLICSQLSLEMAIMFSGKLKLHGIP